MQMYHIVMFTVNSEILAGILFSRMTLKAIFCLLKMVTRHDLRLSVNDRVISPFHEGFIFTKLRTCEVLRK